MGRKTSQGNSLKMQKLDVLIIEVKLLLRKGNGCQRFQDGCDILPAAPQNLYSFERRCGRIRRNRPKVAPDPVLIV